MRIWHHGALSPQSVNGANATVWLIAKAQALLDHQVGLLLDEPPDAASLTLAEQTGLELVHKPSYIRQYGSSAFGSLLDNQSPQIVHMHSVFIPQQAALARNLNRHNIPYVITPHGGVASQVLRRGRMKKSLYSWLMEKPRFYTASAISTLTPKEEEQVRSFVPHYKGILRRVPNPVDADNLARHSWKGNTGAKRLVYLGRFDVLCKGIDILIDIARLLPEVEVHLYGIVDVKTERWLERLKRNLPPNVHFHNPVYGTQKVQILTNASLYIQTSRWEAWGISIAEAMYLGVPCAITDTLDIAEFFREHDLGLVLPPEPKKAASALMEALSQQSRLRQWSKNAQAFAQVYNHPQRVASTYLKLYEEVLAKH